MFTTVTQDDSEIKKFLMLIEGFIVGKFISTQTVEVMPGVYIGVRRFVHFTVEYFITKLTGGKRCLQTMQLFTVSEH